MPLAKLADVYPNYKEKIFDGEDIKKYSAYSLEDDDKIGYVYDALIDEHGRFRYFVIDTRFWFFGKKVLLPTGRAKLDYSRHRIYTIGLTKEQAENLPKYDDDIILDYDYEERVRNVYRPPAATEATMPIYDASSYRYDLEPVLYDTTDENHGKLKLYEQRLVPNKKRHQTGEVAKVDLSDADFQNIEIARIEVYEEVADIQKKTFVREEVSISKKVERDTVEAREKVRREKLQVDTEGDPVVDVVDTRGSNNNIPPA